MLKPLPSFPHHRRGKLSFSAKPSDAMIAKFTPPATPSNPSPATECGTIWVEFLVEKGSIGVGQIKKFVQHCSANSFKAGIMVTAQALSAQARKIISMTQQFTQIE